MMPCIQLHPQRPVNESTIFIIAVRRDAMCKYACARVIFMNLVLIKAYAFKIKASMSCIMTSNQYQDSLGLTLCLVVLFLVFTKQLS